VSMQSVTITILPNISNSHTPALHRDDSNSQPGIARLSVIRDMPSTAADLCSQHCHFTSFPLSNCPGPRPAFRAHYRHASRSPLPPRLVAARRGDSHRTLHVWGVAQPTFGTGLVLDAWYSHGARLAIVISSQSNIAFRDLS